MGSSADEKDQARYCAVPGYFLQCDEEVDGKKFDFREHNFGLKPDAVNGTQQGETPWQAVYKEVERLNISGPTGTQYKLIFVGRHGKGIQNVVEELYGKVEFMKTWAMHEGNRTLLWTDPQLTDLGILQAQQANAFWGTQIESSKMIVPQSFYSSPQRRALQTLQITYSGLKLPDGQVFSPVVHELLRATNGIATADKRGTKTSIQLAYPTWRFDYAFSEADEAWHPSVRESDLEKDVKMKLVLDHLFLNDSNTIISVTSHSGVIAALLRVIGHRDFKPKAGEVFPVLIKRQAKV